MTKFPTVNATIIAMIAAMLLTLNAQAQEASAEKKANADEAPQKIEGVEVTGKRDATSDRRNSTAAKIIINREDIEQYGDTNLGDVLKRLPGVTQGGRPGRGGAVSMRGMGGGYTQILINGERSPPGFSIEQISPEQVERIEILRAPTAETGTRAVAGTINIVLREPLRAQSDEFKAGVQEERSRYSPNLSWNHNDSFSETGTYNLSASLNRNDQLTDTRTITQDSDLLTGAPLLHQEGTSSASSLNDRAYFGGRVQWRLGPGELFSVQPFLMHSQSNTHTVGTLTQSLGNTPAPYATSDSNSTSKNDMLRLNTQLTKRLDSQTRLDVRANIGSFKSKSDSNLTQDGNEIQQTNADITDRSWSTTIKASHTFESGHSGVMGVEVERVNRSETSSTVLNSTNGAPQPDDLSGDLNASVHRTALYVQDEWDPVENLSANLGLRWESIQTNSDDVTNIVNNESRVFSPIGHLVWRFASPRKDQVRLSLTQSYKPPSLQNLISRPRINQKYPVTGPTNNELFPDGASNPALKAELAQGVDLAYERYLNGGGIVSVNFFQRNITDLIRNVPSLETVSWSPQQRWVSRPQNIGNAVTQGIEFDAKFKLSDAVEHAPPVNLRANMSLYNSRVSGIRGPYNRIDQQPGATGNFGMDYKLPSTAWSVGGNFALTPGYTTQTSETQSQFLNTRRVTEVYGLWSVTPKAKLRFGLANIEALDSNTVNSVVDNQKGQLNTVTNIGRTDVSASVRLEMRL
jgi:outer membrane receptor for ferrienterochelin and colicins